MKILCQKNQKVDYIYHISDIHIRLYQFHDVYKKVFELLYKYLKKVNQPEKSIVVITGDLLHSKNELSPECCKVTLDFLSCLADIMPTLFIAGNHDALLTNRGRMDSISSILYQREIPNLYYMKDSGIYQYNNIDFYVDSLLDENGLDIFHETQNNSANIKIGLYHGQLTGWKNVFGHVSEHGERNATDFKNMDFVLLGDIHKYQFMKENVAYAGSLVSQNFGETDPFHGVLVWNLKDKTTKFVKIQNKYRYMELYCHDNDKFMVDEQEYNLESLKLETFANCRIHSNKTDIENKCLLDGLKKKFPSVKFQFSSRKQIQEKIEAENIDFVENEREIVNKYIQKFCNKKKREDVEKYSNEILSQWKEISIFQTSKQWELIGMEFSNMFGYGENNRFYLGKDDSNIIGIFGHNSVGKSTLIEIISMLLYGKLTRYSHGSSIPKEVIRFGQTTSDGKICIRFGNTLYVITKKFQRQKTGKIKVVEKFFKLENCKQVSNIDSLLKDEKCIELTGEQRKRTDKEIEKVIGGFSSFIYNNLFLQQNEESFRFLVASKKKKFLFDLFGYSWLEELEKKFKEEYKKISTEINHMKKQLDNLSGENIKEKIQLLTKKIETMESEYQTKKDAFEQKCQEIKTLYNSMSCSIQKVEKESEKLEKSWNTLKMKLHQEIIKLEKSTQEIREKIAIMKKSLSNNDSIFSTQYEMNKNDTLYQNYSPFFDNKFDNWKLFEKKFSSVKNFQLDKKTILITDLENKIENLSNEIYPIRKDAIIKENYSLEELEKKHKKQQGQLTEIETFIKNANYSDLDESWNENLYHFQELQKDYKILQCEKKHVQEKSHDCDNISFNKKCSSCMENPYYLNRLKWQGEYKKLSEKSKKMKENIQKIIRYFRLQVQDEIEEINVKSVQEYTEKNAQKQKDLKKKEKDLENIHHWLEMYDNTRKHVMNEIVKKEQKELKNELVTLREQKDLYIEYLQNEKILNILDMEWTAFKKNPNIKNFLQEESEEMLQEYEKRLIEQIEDLGKKKHEMERGEQDFLEKKEKMKQDVYIFSKIQKEEEIMKEMEKDLELFSKTQQENKIQLERENVLLEQWDKILMEWKEKEVQEEFYKTLSSIVEKDNLPLYLLSSKFPLLETQINDLIKPFLEKRITFRLDEKNIEIGVYTEAGTCNYLGGMESFIIDLSLKLTFSKFSMIPQSNFFIIDEGISVLDQQRLHNITYLFDFLSNITSNVLLISHIPQIKDFVTESIDIQKDEKHGSLLYYD